MRNKIILILGLLTVIFFITSVNSYQKVARQKKLVDQERLRRMELEEEMSSLSTQNSELEQKSSQLQRKLDQQESAFQENQRVLNQEIAELKKELEKMTKLKERLEKDLGEALISGKSE